MSYGGIYHFRDPELVAIESSTNKQLEACQEIWNNVRREITRLIEEGKVDAGIADVLNTRDEEFRRDTAQYEQHVIDQNVAVRNVRTIGQEGGMAMRRAALGHA